MTSPTARSLEHLRKLGYTVQIVEKWNPYARIRQDLFGMIDILAIKEGEPVLGVQATSDTNLSHRLAKVLPKKELKLWISIGCRFVIYGWGKKGARGKRKMWQLREYEVKLSDL